MHPEERDITPVFTEHARMRCAERGLTTKDAKRAWRNGVIDQPGPPWYGDQRLRVSPDGIVVVYVPGERPIVKTVWSKPDRAA